MATEEQVRALAAFAKIRAPHRLYVCPRCKSTWDTNGDPSTVGVVEEHHHPFCQRCRQAMVLFLRA
jgi:molybdenum cofactor biosynthesis enzyme MoaA